MIIRVPVQALALPLLMTTAWIFPGMILFIPVRTAAALILLVVKSAAAVAGEIPKRFVGWLPLDWQFTLNSSFPHPPAS